MKTCAGQKPKTREANLHNESMESERTIAEVVHFHNSEFF